MNDTDPTGASGPPAALGDARIASLDTIRVVAIVAVICIHTEPFKAASYPLFSVIIQCCRFAVPFFFAASGYLFFRKLSSVRPVGPLFRRFTTRIGLVFLVWSGVYVAEPRYSLVARLGWREGVWHSAITEVGELLTHPLRALMVGTAPHLWFLPALLGGTAIVALLVVIGRARLVLPVASLLYALGLVSGSYSVMAVGIPLPFEASRGVFFSTFFVALGWYLATHGVRIGVPWALALIAGGLGLLLAEAVLLHGRFGLATERLDHLVGTVLLVVGVMAMALSLPGLGAHTVLPYLGRFTLGIYVIHPLVAHSPLMWGVHPHVPEPVWQAAAPLLVYAGSLVVTYLVSRVAMLRPLVM
jgi:surface polysaccharide O-acyltransferase-like enzyme